MIAPAAFNPKEHHHLTDKKLDFAAVAEKAGLAVPEILAVVTQNDPAGAFHSIRPEEALRQWWWATYRATSMTSPPAASASRCERPSSLPALCATAERQHELAKVAGSEALLVD